MAAAGIPAAKAASVKKEIGTARARALLPTGAKPVALAFHKPELPYKQAVDVLSGYTGSAGTAGRWPRGGRAAGSRVGGLRTTARRITAAEAGNVVCMAAGRTGIHHGSLLTKDGEDTAFFLIL